MSREIVLLGAGASKYAGVPMATEMVPRLLGDLPAELRPLARFLLGGLVFSRGIRGLDVESGTGIDVEAFITAVQLLENRHHLELAPFVTAWHPRLQELEAPSKAQVKGTVDRFLTALAADWEYKETRRKALATRFVHAVRVAGGRSVSSYALRELREEVVAALRKNVWLDDASKVDYLSPLFRLAKRQGSLTIASLNYDNAIELAARTGAVSCFVAGVCPPGLVLDEIADATKNPGVQLLKLHGSADWWLMSDGSVVRRSLHEEDPDAATAELAILFGGRNKLTASGPFLDLLFAFRLALSAADRLTVIGYSFRDPHVNEYIRRWFESPGTSRRLRVVAPKLLEDVNSAVEQGVLPEDHFLLMHEDDVEWVDSKAEDALPHLYS